MMDTSTSKICTLLLDSGLGTYRLGDIRRIQIGAMNEIFAVGSKLSSPDFLVKYCSAKRQATLKYQGASFSREACGMNIARQGGVISPSCIVVHESDKPDSPSYLVMEFLPGVPLAQIIFEGIDQKQLNKLLREAASQLSKIHAIEISSVATNEVSADRFFSINRKLFDELDSAIKRIGKQNQMYGQIIDLIRIMHSNADHVLDQSNMVLTHGDITTDNLLYDRQSITLTGIVDWEWSGFSDPTKDLANILLGVNCQSKIHLAHSLSAWQEVLSGYTINSPLKFNERLETCFRFYLGYYAISLYIFFSQCGRHLEARDYGRWIDLLDDDKKWNTFYGNII